MTRRTRTIALIAAGVSLLVAVLVVAIATFDWNYARPWLQSRLSAASGRTVTIDGDITVAWRRSEAADGTKSWLPGPQFSVGRISVGNPAWAKGKTLAELKGVQLDIALWPLLGRTVAIRSLRLIEPTIDFERRKNASNNWTLETQSSGGSGWSFNLGEIAFDDGKVTIADAERGLDATVTIRKLDEPIAYGKRADEDDRTTQHEVIERVGVDAAKKLNAAAKARRERAEEKARPEPPAYIFGWTLDGSLQGSRVHGSGRIGGVLDLQDSKKPFPIHADVQVGETRIALTGTLIDPTSPDALDLRLWLSGTDLAQLYPIAGLTLPSTPPYATVGRLVGHFHPHRSLLRYEDFAARVGRSDLNGTLTYKSGEPRPTLEGKVDSTLLQFKDLGTLIGAEPASASGDKVFPTAPFNTDRWGNMDADVQFTGKRVVRDSELPIHDIDTRIVMQSAVLSLDPFKFKMADGDVAAAIKIDGNKNPPPGSVELNARKLKLSGLFMRVAELNTSLGVLNAHVKLSGSGKSIADLLGSSNGEVKVLMTDGEVSKALLEKAGLNVANIAITALIGDKQVGIECAAADMSASNGVITPQVFLFDTDNALIEIDGQIDLNHEQVDLTLHPHTKGVRVFSLRSPLHVQGPFTDIDVSVDKKSLFARGGAAVGLALFATPLAALLPLIAPSKDDQERCTPLIAQLRQASQGDPGASGKTRTSKKAKSSPAIGNE